MTMWWADVKGGCLPGHGGSSGRMPETKLRGVQVFTYKQLEMSTDKFNEANVIGNGGYGVVYRGVLIDGTVAAIKVLQREGKQWERSFRLEVCHHFIYCLFFHFLHPLTLFPIHTLTRCLNLCNVIVWLHTKFKKEVRTCLFFLKWRNYNIGEISSSQPTNIKRK